MGRCSGFPRTPFIRRSYGGNSGVRILLLATVWFIVGIENLKRKKKLASFYEVICLQVIFVYWNENEDFLQMKMTNLPGEVNKYIYLRAMLLRLNKL